MKFLDFKGLSLLQVFSLLLTLCEVVGVSKTFLQKISFQDNKRAKKVFLLNYNSRPLVFDKQRNHLNVAAFWSFRFPEIDLIVTFSFVLDFSDVLRSSISTGSFFIFSFLSRLIVSPNSILYLTVHLRQQKYFPCPKKSSCFIGLAFLLIQYLLIGTITWFE